MKDLKITRKRCPKCGGVIGENIDGKPICQCEVMTEQKICTKCKESKAVICFSSHSGHESGLQSHCKTCQRQDQKEYCESEQGSRLRVKYREGHREEHNIGVKKYRSTIRGYLYTRWYNMVDRCSNPKAKGYKHYGGRGIKCLFETFNDFFIHVTEELEYNTKDQLIGLQIDRIDNDGHYEPGNIRLVTPAVNRNNRSDSKKEVWPGNETIHRPFKQR